MTDVMLNDVATWLNARPLFTSYSQSELPDVIERALRDELAVPAGDDDRVKRAVDTALVYVDNACNGSTVPCNVYVDCVVTCAADLYNSRSARLGVMDVGTDGIEPYRIPTDPLRGVWPKLNAAGVLTGGNVIA